MYCLSYIRTVVFIGRIEPSSLLMQIRCWLEINIYIFLIYYLLMYLHNEVMYSAVLWLKHYCSLCKKLKFLVAMNVNFLHTSVDSRRVSA
jgi:hypothetical protein